MMFHKRTSFFPLVLALLTLALVVLMIFAFASRGSVSKTPVPASSKPVSAEQYDQELSALTTEFTAVYQAAVDSQTKLSLVQKTLAQLLAMTVPAAEKEKHLALAVELSQMQQALTNQTGEEAAAFERFRQYVSD
ncbi:hypothetical protein HZA85_02690 [Candidatus Uhrbacteria bacterium]|nr:hypothetical protein [Candidatus Uhrbacteria bacterium]